MGWETFSSAQHCCCCGRGYIPKYLGGSRSRVWSGKGFIRSYLLYSNHKLQVVRFTSWLLSKLHFLSFKAKRFSPKFPFLQASLLTCFFDSMHLCFYCAFAHASVLLFLCFCASVLLCRGSGGKNVIFQIAPMTKVSTQIHSSMCQYDIKFCQKKWVEGVHRGTTLIIT